MSKGWKAHRVLLTEKGQLQFYKAPSAMQDTVLALFPTSIVKPRARVHSPVTKTAEENPALAGLVSGQATLDAATLAASGLTANALLAATGSGEGETGLGDVQEEREIAETLPGIANSLPDMARALVSVTSSEAGFNEVSRAARALFVFAVIRGEVLAVLRAAVAELAHIPPDYVDEPPIASAPILDGEKNPSHMVSFQKGALL